MTQSSYKSRLALVLSGGGARGAYEAGVLHYVRTMLPPKARQRAFDIQCGASVGSINTCYMASMAHNLERQGQEIRTIWESVREEDIYNRGNTALFKFLGKSSAGIIGNLFKSGGKLTPHFNGFLDTSPFYKFLEKTIPWPNISKNIRKGVVKALSIVATNVLNGRTELFMEKHDSVEYNGDYFVRYTKINALHALASSAIPIVFPTVMIDGISYTDGGLRLNTPMSPAIQLGASHILIIGLHHRKSPGDILSIHAVKGRPASIGEVVGRVMNSLFLDRIQYDMEQLERINTIIDWAGMLYGDNFLQDLNTLLTKKKIRGDIADRGLKKIQALRITPSEDIGDIFSQCYIKGHKHHFSSFEKMLVRILDIDPSSGIDFLSYISFMPEYLKSLLELGFEDARSHHKDLLEFFDAE